MINTVAIRGYVMAPFGKRGTFIRGKRRDILVTGVSEDEEIPLIIREALVGLKASCILTKEEVEESGIKLKEVPSGSMLAYSQEIIELLLSAGKKDAATELEKISGDQLDMYIFKQETFELSD